MLVNLGGVIGHVPPLHMVKAIRGCAFRQQEIRARLGVIGLGEPLEDSRVRG